MGKGKDALKKLSDFLTRIFFPSGFKCLVCHDELNDEGEKFLCEKCKAKISYNNGKICKKCGMPIEGEKGYCSHCKTKQLYYKKARAPFIYDGDIKNLIHRFKYNGEKYLSAYFGKCICDEIILNDFVFDLIVPIPLFIKKEKQRGFNQSFLLAKEIGKNMGKTVLSDCLVRDKWTESQTSLTYEERQKNLEGAFKVLDLDKIKGKKILLVDDVFTTGATCEECSMALAKNGANDIYVITIAHTVPKAEND